MTRITSAIAAALVASASFGSVAFAEGDYYEGVSKAPVTASASVDRMSTGSIFAQKADAHNVQAKAPADLNSGDYFSGANRPN